MSYQQLDCLQYKKPWVPIINSHNSLRKTVSCPPLHSSKFSPSIHTVQKLCFSDILIPQIVFLCSHRNILPHELFDGNIKPSVLLLKSTSKNRGQPESTRCLSVNNFPMIPFIILWCLPMTLLVRHFRQTLSARLLHSPIFCASLVLVLHRTTEGRKVERIDFFFAVSFKFQFWKSLAEMTEHFSICKNSKINCKMPLT